MKPIEARCISISAEFLRGARNANAGGRFPKKLPGKVAPDFSGVRHQLVWTLSSGLNTLAIVRFVSLTEALDLTTPVGRAMAAMLAVFAAFEREVLQERTRAGLEHARQNGKRLGRPLTAGLRAAAIQKLHHAGVSKSEIVRRLQIGRTSVRRILEAEL
jgi:hypothetical protein